LSNKASGTIKQPDSNLGAYFHKIIADFSKEAKEHPFIHQHQWPRRFQELMRGIVANDDLTNEERKFLEDALNAFYNYLLEELTRFANRLDHLFWEIEKDIHAYYDRKDSIKIKIIGRIDRLSKMTANAIELVDYKILRDESSTANQKDKLQLALYTWILKQSGLEPTRISIASFCPNRKVIELNKNELESCKC